MAASRPALRRAAARNCPLAASRAIPLSEKHRPAPPRAGPERLSSGAEPQVRLWELGSIEKKLRCGGWPMPDALS